LARATLGEIALKKTLVSLIGALLLAVPMLAQSQAAKDTLVIGMSQYPPSLHPGIDPTVAKTYGMRFAYRPIATYNDDRQMQCFLCTEVPTVANGRAKLVDLGGGKKGLTVKFTLLPQAKWGDGTPITIQGCGLHLVGWQQTGERLCAPRVVPEDHQGRNRSTTRTTCCT
jgi:ABC-type transport system substrate-binding protein